MHFLIWFRLYNNCVEVGGLDICLSSESINYYIYYIEGFFFNYMYNIRLKMKILQSRGDF